MNGRIETWQFGAIVGGVVALLILVIVLVIGITFLRKYLHNKQRKRRHYSQHVEDGTDATAAATAGKETSLSRVTFGVLWSLRQPDDKNRDHSSSQSNITTGDELAKPHAFAMATEPNNLPSSREDTIKITTDAAAVPPDMVQLELTSLEQTNRSEEVVYYELENPSEVKSLQLPTSEDLTKLRHHSSNSYTSISSDVPHLPPPPSVFSPHRRGRRHSLPNSLVPVVTQNTMLQPVAIDNPNYINYRYGRRNSDPSVSSILVPQALHISGVASPAEYERPMASYMSLDLSTVSCHSYTSLNIFNDTPPEPVVFPRQQLSMRTRMPINHLRMNSIPEENNYEKLNPLPKPAPLLSSHDPQ